MTQDYLIKLLTDIVEKSKTDKNVLKRLKEASVHAQMYELAAEFRDIEVKSFPKTEEQKEAELLANNIKTLFGMVDLSVPTDTCWIVYQAVTLYNKKKGKTDLKSMSEFKSKMKELFEDNQ